MSNADSHEALSGFKSEGKIVFIVIVVLVDVEERFLHASFVVRDIKTAELLVEGIIINVELSVVLVEVINLRLGVVSPVARAIRVWSMVAFGSPWVSNLD